jgi:S-adenosylmethionine decarboxylase
MSFFYLHNLETKKHQDVMIYKHSEVRIVKQKKFVGKLITVDMYNCGTEEIILPSTAEELLRKGCEEFAFNCQQVICAQEEDLEEYSLFAICHHGHVALHVYSKLGFMTADVFSCNSKADSENMARYLRVAFKADKSKITQVDRGEFGSQNDMKPTHRSKIKLIRRTKNFTQNMSDKFVEIMSKPRSM